MNRIKKIIREELTLALEQGFAADDTSEKKIADFQKKLDDINKKENPLKTKLTILSKDRLKIEKQMALEKEKLAREKGDQAAQNNTDQNTATASTTTTPASTSSVTGIYESENSPKVSKFFDMSMTWPIDRKIRILFEWVKTGNLTLRESQSILKDIYGEHE